jgi:Tfp pilus assembly protein FimT
LSTGYDTAGATEYDDAVASVVKGVATNASSYITGANTYVSFEHDFTTDGSVNVVFLCEGDGGVTQQKTAITLADSTVSASCIPAVENNA